jgi:hypothetical protein
MRWLRHVLLAVASISLFGAVGKLVHANPSLLRVVERRQCRLGDQDVLDLGAAGGDRADYDLIPSKRAAVSPSIAARSASLRPGVLRM